MTKHESSDTPLAQLSGVQRVTQEQMTDGSVTGQWSRDYKFEEITVDFDPILRVEKNREE